MKRLYSPRQLFRLSTPIPHSRNDSNEEDEVCLQPTREEYLFCVECFSGVFFENQAFVFSVCHRYNSSKWKAIEMQPKDVAEDLYIEWVGNIMIEPPQVFLKRKHSSSGCQAIGSIFRLGVYVSATPPQCR